MIPTVYLVGGAAAISAAVSFGAAWQIQGWRQDAARYAAGQALVQSQNDARKLVDRAAEAYQDGQDAARQEATINDGRVNDVAATPAYSADCLDPAGLRIVADEIRAANARRKSSSPVPADSRTAKGKGRAASVERRNDPPVR